MYCGIMEKDKVSSESEKLAVSIVGGKKWPEFTMTVHFVWEL